MATVLIVDDVKDYCDELALALIGDGHTVASATSGREAIALAALNRPQVVVTDWMLKDHVHGLDVVQAIKIIDPSVRPILMTGFASADLRSDAEYMDVLEFLEKPFPLDRVRQAVRAAANVECPARETPKIGVLETNMEGLITYMNPYATLLLGRGKRGLELKDFTDLFSSDEIALIDGATSQWIELAPSAWVEVRPQQTETWFFRAREITGQSKKLFVILDHERRSYQDNPLVYRILGYPEPKPTTIPVKGHILVVDDIESVRRIAVDILRECNYSCHGAENHEEAIRIFAHDSDITYVVVDYEMSKSNPLALMKRFRALRPEVTIIGTGSNDQRKDFEAIGVSMFIPKPWTVQEFLEIFSRTVQEENTVNHSPSASI